MGSVRVNASLPKPPDGGWGWVVVFGSFMIHVFADGFTYSFGVFYNVLLNHFNEGSGATSWIASILVGVTLCSGPIASALVNRYGCRAVTIAGALLASLCLCLSMFAQNVATLYITVGLLTGLGLGLIYLPAIVSVTCYFEKYRSLATGIAVCGSGLGTFLIAPLTQVLVDEYTWRGAFLITGGLMLNCVVFGILFRPLVGPLEEEVELKTVDTAEANGGNKTEANGGQKRPHSIHGGPVPIVAVGNSSNDKARLALSQPMLTIEHRRSNQWGSGIMYRKDVLYSGSLANISHHHRKTRSASWIPGDLRKGEDKPLMGMSEIVTGEDRTTFCGCIPCATETADTLNEMLDFSLLKDPIFIIFTVSNFCTSIGFNVPYVYMVPQAVTDNKLTEGDASYLLSVIGIANTVGRIVLGYLSDKKWVNRLWVYNTSLALCGFSTALSIYCYDFVTFAVYAAVFGFTVGAYVGLTSVILVDLLGLDKLTNAFGLLLLFQGLASLIGPPITGWLKDWTNSYDPGFIVSGLTIAISGLMLFVVPTIQKMLETRERRRSLQNRAALRS
ncbi:monocarboxylate transporter 1 isoform X2 [Rhodnius prolixus]